MTTLLTAALLLLGASSASADVDQFEVHQYRADFGVSAAQAEETLETQAHGAGMVDQLEGIEGDRFAGVWFDNESGEFVIPVVAGRAPIANVLGRGPLAGRFRMPAVDSTWKELEAAQQGLGDALQPFFEAGVATTSLDPRTNAVVIGEAQGARPAEAAQIRAIAASQAVDVEVRNVNVPVFQAETRACRTFAPRVCSKPLRGGVDIGRYTPGGGGATYSNGLCTAGFKAVGNVVGNRFILTAGHCATKWGNRWGSEEPNENFYEIGTVEESTFGPGGDWAKIKANGSVWDTPSWPTLVTHYWGNQEYPIKYESSSYLGEYVCFSGSKTGTTCGSVRNLNVGGFYDPETGTPLPPYTEVPGICNRPGDSGGPIFSFSSNTALGLLSAGEGDEKCESGSNEIAYYVEITDATDALGVHVAPRIPPPPPPPPPVQPPVKAAFVDSGDANSLTAWEFGSNGWQQIFLWGHPVAAGTKPFVMSYEGTKHIFFVDAGRGNKITEWSWNPTTGWQQAFLETDPVAAGSSLTGLVINGYPELFFADAPTNRSITAEVRINGAWYPAPFYGDSLAPNTSPSAIISNGQPQIYFNDGSKGNTMAAWTWNSVSGWQQSFFYGDTIAANTSPSAIANNNQAQAYFNDASKGNTMSVWVWGPGLLQQTPFYGDAIAANTSPSAISNSGSPHIYFNDASKGNTMTVWAWAPTSLKQSFLYGDTIAANSSPTATLTAGGQDQVFFADESTNKSLALWEWGSTLQQTRLYGHLALAGTSPGA